MLDDSACQTGFDGGGVRGCDDQPLELTWHSS